MSAKNARSACQPAAAASGRKSARASQRKPYPAGRVRSRWSSEGGRWALAAVRTVPIAATSAAGMSGSSLPRRQSSRAGLAATPSRLGAPPPGRPVATETEPHAPQAGWQPRLDLHEPGGGSGQISKQLGGRGALLVGTSHPHSVGVVPQRQAGRGAAEQGNDQGRITRQRQPARHAAHPGVDPENLRQHEHAGPGWSLGGQGQPALQRRLFPPARRHGHPLAEFGIGPGG